ncbi:trypsin-like peptidase domain-containing protein [Acinetobacter baumannii]|uniref:trypsin-like peptidase domain-containing protein n=1 Tax=Acinetobacter baumannii TaxID=470 RepID=UPI0024DEE25E|nr:trypsin-like peptidase domain-containing protein [Acinetobacter baumannii]MDK2201893.1 trypsin-like peptidase domain-containing protein [Acinetobacter baumannii]MDV7382631.1 trypsin-like peptidase domain-containing protein [Acinetobacter baumannii]
MQPNSIKDQLYYSTVMIQSAQSSGTAFLLSKNIGQLTRIYLVSNKHVVKNQTECQIRFHKSESLNPENKIGDFIHHFSNEEWINGWKFHNDDEVDLAVFDLTPTMAALNEQQQCIFFRSLNTNSIATKEKNKEIIAMEKVFFVGYPNAFRDEINNLPIARSGYLATPLYTDFEGKETFLLDASIFEGSSGSPIFIVNENFETYTDTSGNAKINARCILVGVNSSTITRVRDKQYLNIGYAWKAYKILEIIEQNEI